MYTAASQTVVDFEVRAYYSVPKNSKNNVSEREQEAQIFAGRE